MSRTLFENSKAALAFAGMTILGAVMMVGTSEKGGVLSRLDEQLAEKRASIAADASAFAEAQSVGDQPSDEKSGWGKPDAVFGEFSPAQSNQPNFVPGPALPAQSKSVTTGPIEPGAIVVFEANPGTPSATGVAVITDRKITIEPK